MTKPLLARALIVFSLIVMAILVGVTVAYAGLISIAGGRGSPTQIGGIDPAADWAIRTSGALRAENFSEFADTTELRNYEETGPNSSRMALTTLHALSGKAVEFTTLGTDNAVSAGPIMALNTRRMKGQNMPETVYDEIYIQVVSWTDAFVDWPFKSSSNNAPKFFILDRAPQCDVCSGYSPSGNPGEIVIDDQSTHGFVTGYRVCTKGGCAGNFTPWDRNLSTPLNSSNFSRQNAVDRGTALTDENSYQRRYGPTYSGMTCDSQTAGTPLSTQCGSGYPDPDAAAGGVTWNKGGYTVVEVYANYTSDRVLVWAAHYGDAPLLIQDSSLSIDGAAQLNTRTDISGWSGFTLTNYRTNGTTDSGRPDFFTYYAEVITKLGDGAHNAGDGIPFPGNKVLP